MPISLGFQVYPWIDQVLRLRQNRLFGYTMMLLAVGFATLGRAAVEDHVGARSRSSPSSPQYCWRPCWAAWCREPSLPSCRRCWRGTTSSSRSTPSF